MPRADYFELESLARLHYFQLVGKLRNKLGSNIITTVKGIGYRIDEQ